MVRNIFSVGGWTIVSRLTGFLRDMALAALLGGGALNDAYVAAIKLPEPVPADFRRGVVQRRLSADLHERAREEGPRGSGAFREPGIHHAHPVADRAARAGLSRYASARAADVARLREPARQVRPCGRDVADHVSIHRFHRRVRAASGHAQRQQFLERARGGAGGGQCLHDRLSRLRGLLFPKSRPASPAWRAGAFSPRARRSS